MSDNPFAGMTRKARWQTRLNRWRDFLTRPLRPTRLVPGRPGPANLLLIGVDTLRADHLGLCGYGQPTSPHLDRLAAGGVILEDVTAPAPWTLPSFASALTGRLPGGHGAFLPGKTRNMDSQMPRRLNENVLTLAGHLRSQGYRTAAFYSNQFFAFGLAESFDEHVYLNLPAAEIARQGREWLRRHADRPCFCFLLFNDPHEPTTPDGEDLAPFLPRLQGQGIPCDPATLRLYARWGVAPGTDLTRAEFPPRQTTDQARQIKLAIYDATIHYVDRVLGDLQDSLRAWGLDTNTLVTVFSDHGEEFLDHAEWSHQWGHDPRGIHGIGHGHSHFQELLHVPWVSWGAGVPAGQRWRHPVSLLDLTPTLLRWLGVAPLPGSAPGGFGSHLTGLAQEGQPTPGRPLLSEAIAYGPDLVAIRQDHLKLIAHRDGRALALFDLSRDPGETRDLRATEPDAVARLLDILTEWWQSTADRDGREGGDWEDLDDTIRQRLKDLGYSD